MLLVPPLKKSFPTNKKIGYFRPIMIQPNHLLKFIERRMHERHQKFNEEGILPILDKAGA